VPGVLHLEHLASRDGAPEELDVLALRLVAEAIDLRERGHELRVAGVEPGRERFVGVRDRVDSQRGNLDGPIVRRLDGGGNGLLRARVDARSTAKEGFVHLVGGDQLAFRWPQTSAFSEPFLHRVVVRQRFRQISLFQILHHANGAMTLGQTFAIGAQDHRDMPEAR